jgi:hypothetical protein
MNERTMNLTMYPQFTKRGMYDTMVDMIQTSLSVTCDRSVVFSWYSGYLGNIGSCPHVPVLQRLFCDTHFNNKPPKVTIIGRFIVSLNGLIKIINTEVSDII